MMSGTRLTTPSISGAVFKTPTPSAASPSNGIGPNIPGHSNMYGKGSPILATPLGTGFLLTEVVPVCAITTPLFTSASDKILSPPNLSGSENIIGITIIPAPASRSFQIISAI